MYTMLRYLHTVNLVPIAYEFVKKLCEDLAGGSLENPTITGGSRDFSHYLSFSPNPTFFLLFLFLF